MHILCTSAESTSNATLRDRILHLTFNSPWSILAKYDMGSLRDTDLIPNFGKTEFWLPIWDEVRTYFERGLDMEN